MKGGDSTVTGPLLCSGLMLVVCEAGEDVGHLSSTEQGTPNLDSQRTRDAANAISGGQGFGGNCPTLFLIVAARAANSGVDVPSPLCGTRVISKRLKATVRA